VKTLVIIPTYNEAQNICKLLEEILSLRLKNLAILIVDDNSPDGTGRLVEEFRQKNAVKEQIFLLSRKRKEGLGKAYLAGFYWALAHRYERIVTMDADFSHNPQYLPTLFSEAKEDTLVVGSRYIKGGKVKGWGPLRYLNSLGANLISRLLLGLKPRDVTAGYKCYPASFLKSIDLENLVSSGYAFQVEMLLLAQDRGFKIKEVPIVFVDRRVGESKIAGELFRSAAVVFRLFLKRKAIHQLIKFVLVGTSGTIIDFSIYFVATRFLHLFYLLAKILSFLLAVFNNYLWNRLWTFRSLDKNKLWEFARFGSTSLIGLGLNTLIMYIFVEKVKMYDITAWIVATLFVFFWNFIISKFWVFKK